MLSLTSFLALNSLLRLSLFFFSVNTNAIKEHNITISNAWKRVEKRYRVHPSSLFFDDINDDDDDDDEKEEEDSFFHPLIARALLFYSSALFFIKINCFGHKLFVTKKKTVGKTSKTHRKHARRGDDDASQRAYRDAGGEQRGKKKIFFHGTFILCVKTHAHAHFFKTQT